MLHKTVKAASTITDQGTFSAIAAAYTVDRANEQIQRGAFEETIVRWQMSGKNIPLHWDHSGDPQDIIGTVDPSTMREADEGLYVKGQLDLENSEVAREAWRLMKSNSVAFSFGYLVGSEEKNAEGVTQLKDIDLFEVSVTPAPMNPDTRILELKSETQSGTVLDVDEGYELTFKTPDEAPGAGTGDKVPLRVTAKDLPSNEVETVESEAEAKPATKDPLRNQIDRELIDIALGR